MENDISREDYQRLHERFVSNGTGSDSPVEILAISTISHLAVLINGLVVFIFNQSWSSENDSKERSQIFLWFSYLREWIITALPLLLSLTIMSEDWIFIVIVMSCTVVGLWLAIDKCGKGTTPKNATQRNQVARKTSKNQKEAPKTKPTTTHNKLSMFSQLGFSSPEKMIAYITNYRSSMLLVTSICIIAVDFPIFPRRFGKTENFGFGLMDIGVGSFVFANGIISLEAREGTEWIKKSRTRYLMKAIKVSVPLLILGFVRLLMVKLSGYHNHVTEYGLHWNFFFTLACTETASSIIFAIFPSTLSVGWIVAVLLAVFQETMLTLGVSEWILENQIVDRSQMDLVAANREGIVSIGGYLALYFAGVAWGRQIFSQQKTLILHYLKDAQELGKWVVLMWASLYSSKNVQLFLPPSRRLANWTYFNWMIAYNLTLLFLFLVCDLFLLYCQQVKPNRTSLQKKYLTARKESQRHTVQAAAPVNRKKVQTREKDCEELDKSEPPEINDITSDKRAIIDLDSKEARVSVIYSAIARNNLAYFLVANLLTGLINITIPTIHITGCPAILVLAVYTMILNMFIVTLYRMNIKLL